MKTNFSFLLLFLIAAVSAKAQSVSMYMLELENHTKWEAVDTKWNGQRNQWVTNCKTENTPQKSAPLLLQFESNIKWEAVQDNWKKRRDGWVKECVQANSVAQLVKLLLELESNIKWSAVDEKWKARRSGWINELNGIGQGTITQSSRNMENTSAFRSVTIGNQTWMAENLHVDRFRNGDLIPQVKTQEEWDSAKLKKQPAWMYCNNSNEYGSKYGKLYNWYAVNDPRGLAPEGWHIPSFLEWDDLDIYLGGKMETVLKLKSKDGWIDNQNGTDQSGFSALPGGNCYDFNKCYNLGKAARWWSAKEVTPSIAETWVIKNDFSLIITDTDFKHVFNSVRCIKNK